MSEKHPLTPHCPTAEQCQIIGPYAEAIRKICPDFHLCLATRAEVNLRAGRHRAAPPAHLPHRPLHTHSPPPPHTEGTRTLTRPWPPG